MVGRTKPHAADHITAMSAVHARTIFLDSSNADSVSEDGSHTWYFPSALFLGPLGSIVQVQVLDFTAWNVNYNVTEGISDTLEVTIAGVDYTVTIDEGQYSIITLLTAIETQVPSLNFTYDTTTNRITITCAASFSISSASTMLPTLGFQDNTSYASSLVSGLYKLSSPRTVNCGGLSRIDITTSLSTRNTFGSDQEAGVFYLARVPVGAVGWGELISWTGPSGVYSVVSDHVISYLTVKLLDQNGNAITFHGTPWSMTLYAQAIVNPAWVSLDEQTTRLEQMRENFVTSPVNNTSRQAQPPQQRP